MKLVVPVKREGKPDLADIELWPRCVPEGMIFKVNRLSGIGTKQRNAGIFDNTLTIEHPSRLTDRHTDGQLDRWLDR